MPIEEASLRYSVSTGITYSGGYEEFEACVAAGLDLWAWEQGQYPAKFQAKVIAWHKCHMLVGNHSEDAAAIAAERRARAARKGKK